jgi:hypothetical protein
MARRYQEAAALTPGLEEKYRRLVEKYEERTAA